MIRRHAFGLGILFLAGFYTASPQQCNASILFELSNPDPFRNDSWSFGEIFTVGANNLNVTALGAFDDFKNGFVTTGGIPVGIFRESDSALLTSTNVLSTDTLIGNYRFADITPVTLLAGAQYRVVAVNRDDQYNIDTNFTVDPSVTYNGYGYTASTTLVRANSFTGSERVWMANMEFDNGNPGAVPEPMSLAVWCLLLCAGGAIYIRTTNQTKKQSLAD